MIELAIRKPVAVAVGVLIVLLFGGLSLLRIPVQLTPDLVKPQVTIDTIWPGASPHEIESEIVPRGETIDPSLRRGPPSRGLHTPLRQRW